MAKAIRLAAIVGMVVVLGGMFPSPVQGHPGNTDGNGCHTCRTNCPSWGYSYGEYHCHGGGSASGGSSGGSGGYTPTYNTKPTALIAHEHVTRYTVRLDASSSYDGDGYVASHAWSVGTEQYTGAIIEHTFPGDGEFVATLVVTDGDGATSTVSEAFAFRPPPTSSTSPPWHN